MSRDEPELIDLATYRRLSARTRPARARVPRAASQPRDGLTTLLRAGWSTRTRDGGREWQLYQNWGERLETQWYTDQGAACAEAKQLQKAKNNERK